MATAAGGEAAGQFSGLSPYIANRLGPGGTRDTADSGGSNEPPCRPLPAAASLARELGRMPS